MVQPIGYDEKRPPSFLASPLERLAWRSLFVHRLVRRVYTFGVRAESPP